MTNGPTSPSELNVRPATTAGPPTDAALTELRRRLVGLAVKLLWNRQDAEEVVQEAFKVAMTSGPRLPHERFGPWMMRTVTNLCLNLRRRHRPEPLADWMSKDLPVANAAPDAQAERVEQLDRLRQAIATLPEQQRVALILRTMEQMDYLDVAEVMGLSVGAVRSHVHFARQRLAELLGVQTKEGGR
jgi:RNA polymerase sigma-70 factor, ECF subfamily